MGVQLFTWLDAALHASPLLALAGASIWGVLSILLSPCHLASIPLIIGFIDDQGRIGVRRAFVLSLLFSLGILITLGAVGAITSGLGRLAGDVGPWGNYLVAAVFVVVGLHFLGLIPLPFLAPAPQPAFRRQGMRAAFLLGLTFGIALGPCTFAFMAPMLGVVFGVAATSPAFAVSLILLYALGHTSVIVLAGTFTQGVQGYLDWDERSRGSVILKKVCGGLLMMGAVYLAISAQG